MYIYIYIYSYIHPGYTYVYISLSILLSRIALACSDVQFPDLGTDSGSHAPDPGFPVTFSCPCFVPCKLQCTGVVRPTAIHKVGCAGVMSRSMQVMSERAISITII